MKKKWIAVGLTALCIVGLSGCKNKNEPSKSELKANVEALNNMVAAKNNQVDSLKRLLASYNPNLAEVADLSDYITLATGEEAYVSFRDRVNVLNDIKVEPSNQIQNETIINLTNNVKFVPTDSWSIKMGSGKMIMNHVNGVYGEVETYKYIGQTNEYTCRDEFIMPHLEAIKATPLEESLIFLSNGSRAGVQINSRIKVATLKDGTNHIEVEEMTEPYSEVYETDENGQPIIPETSAVETSAVETSATETSATETSETAESESGDTSVAVETDENGQPIETSSVESGELTGETVEQEESDIYSVDNYIYNCGAAVYSTDGLTSHVIVFKFFYKEGDNVNYTEKKDFVNTVIKSFAIDGNYLTLQ